MRKQWVWFCIGTGFLLGCAPHVPVRNLDFEKPQQAMSSYYDYCRLEKAGVESVVIKTRYFNRTVSLAFYLFSIAQAFESFGRMKDAEKLYLRLLMSYPVLYENGQLGAMTENRLFWILGDKSWVYQSLDELILLLEQALIKQDGRALGKLMSHDFAFGRDASERFAVKYTEGLQLIIEDFAYLQNPAVEIISKNENSEVVLKITGWEKGKKNWYFALHKNYLLKGWEWDLAYWEKAELGLQE